MNTNGDFTLKELLESKTIPELKEMFLILGYTFKSGVKKAEMVEVITTIMLGTPELVVSGMYYYELQACLDVIEGRMTLAYAEQSGLLLELNRFGLIYSLSHGDTGENTLHFEHEMGEKMLPLIRAELQRREMDGSLLAEKLALGCANIYGFTELYYLNKLFPELEKRLGRSLDEVEIAKLFGPILYTMCAGFRIKTRPFISPFAPYNGFCLDTRHIDPDMEGKTFDFDTILSYGEMPYPHIPGKAAEQLRKGVKRLLQPGLSVEDVVRSLWLDKQNPDLSSPIANLGRYLRMNDINDVNRTVSLIVNFANTVPYWKMRGYSSDESFRQTVKNSPEKLRPQISIGPNLKAMGIESFEQIQGMARRGESFPSPTAAAAPRRVGRNEPCPCGSGKKFKHCCGKN